MSGDGVAIDLVKEAMGNLTQRLTGAKNGSAGLEKVAKKAMNQAIALKADGLVPGLRRVEQRCGNLDNAIQPLIKAAVDNLALCLEAVEKPTFGGMIGEIEATKTRINDLKSNVEGAPSEVKRAENDILGLIGDRRAAQTLGREMFGLLRLVKKNLEEAQQIANAASELCDKAVAQINDIGSGSVK